jgi:alcohol dehydrogenase
MTDTRDVWRIDRAGSLDRLRRRAEPIERPAPGEARVRVEAVGLNFADIFACLGLYSATPAGPFVPGLEFGGAIEDLGPPAASGSRGPEEAALTVGDRVMGVTRFGAYVTALNADVRGLRRAPSGWGAAEAAALPVQALTAWYGLTVLGRVARNEVVLVQSAAGGVGLNALEMLAAVGARAVAVVGHETKRAIVAQRCGIEPERVVVRDRRRFGAQLDEALAGLQASGFDVVFDAVQGPCFGPSYERLRPEGRYVVYGAADFMTAGARPDYVRLAWRYLTRPRVDPLQMIAENRGVMGFNLIWLWDALDRLPAALDAIARLVQRPPLVGATFPFADAPAGMRHLQSGRSVGKVVLVCPP